MRKNEYKKIVGLLWKELMKKEIDATNKKYILGYFLLISVLELCAYSQKGVFSIIASRLWLLTAVFLFFIFISSTILKVLEDIKNKRYFLAIGFLGMICFLFYYIGNLGYADINADATQQIAAGLSSFDIADWNYTGLAFLGYANRQYVLAAIPALLFGRSIFTLHLGFAGLFIIGLSMLYFETRNWLKKYNLEENLALIPCYTIMAFRFIAEYYLNYEQAITPVALTMIGISLFMKLYRKLDLFTVIAITWIGCFYCDSYTPIIASLGLLICFLGMYGLKLFHKNWDAIRAYEKTVEFHNFIAKIEVLCGCIGTMGIFFIATLLGKREDRLSSVREEIDLVSYATETWIEFFTDKNAVFLGVFAGIIILYIVLSLTFRLSMYDFVISVWVFGVVLFANLLVGYTNYEKAWILQRNMIIIPVLVMAIFLCMIRILTKYKIQMDKKSLAVVLIFLFFMSMGNFGKEHQSFNYFRYIQPMKYMIGCAEEVLKENELCDTEEFNIVLVTDNILQSNIYDYAKFFYPNAATYSITSDGNIPDIDWNKETFVFAETEENLLRFGIIANQRNYQNERYHTEVIWYYGKVER